jgi:hypothetical protein
MIAAAELVQFGTGFEPLTNSSGKTDLARGCGAESGAVGARDVDFGPDLAAVIASWPSLPAPIRAGILAMVRTS